MNLKQLASLATFAVALPLVGTGCGADDLCCNEFQIGADLSGVDFGVEADVAAQFSVLAQASADLAGAASGALTDVGNACRAIALDLGATTAEIDTEDAKEPNDRVKGLCTLASAKVNAGLTVSGSGKVELDVQFTPPVCEASVSAKANCQAQCSGGVKCDIKANPPTCEGGKLEVSCKGGCTAEGSASVACTGSCTGGCTGSCTAQGGVECAGKCEGTCSAGGEAGGSGIQADGTCNGICEGTCEVTPPGVTCEGSCNGSCDATCQGSADVSVKCDGKCDADFEPLSCKGGELKGGCEVDAKCDANCDASVSAKAECRPPALSIGIRGNANIDAAAELKVAAVIDTLKLNLPNIIVVLKARGQAFVDLTGSIAGSVNAVVDPGKLNVKGTACLIPIVKAVGDAAGNIEATLSASGTIAGSAGVN